MSPNLLFFIDITLRRIYKMIKIYSAKFMNEATASLADKVIKTPVRETYLFSSINILREMNNVIDENRKQLFVQISEAESNEQEI